MSYGKHVVDGAAEGEDGLGMWHSVVCGSGSADHARVSFILRDVNNFTRLGAV